MALAAGLPTIFRDLQEVPEGKFASRSATPHPQLVYLTRLGLDRSIFGQAYAET